MNFDTDVVHGAVQPEPITGALMTPVHLTSTYQIGKVGKNFRYDYSRTANPTRDVLQDQLALLEGGRYCSTHITGMAAATCVAHIFKKGDHIICSQDCYGGVFRLLSNVMAPLGLKTTFLDLQDLEAVKAAICDNTRLIWAESPTNPLIRLVDIKALARIAHDKNLLFLLDNTFATPVLQKPLEMGADIVIHSLTKYINGHCDTLGGAVITIDAGLAERIDYMTNAMGIGSSAFDSWMIIRGLKTLPLRFRQQQSNAETIAQFLEEHNFVEKVFYPGLESHPDHALARRQQKGFGAMIAFEVKGSKVGAFAFAENTKLFSLAESLGGVHSLVEVPAFQSHASMTPEAREQAGISDGLIRLSVGVEDKDDLVADIKQALDAAQKVVESSH